MSKISISGFRAWQRGWPICFRRRAHVIHRHRATTSRYYSPEFLDQVLELNYLRFLARTIVNARIFRQLWREAVHRLEFLSWDKRITPRPPWRSPRPGELRCGSSAAPRAALTDEHILAIGSGAVVVAPGRSPGASRWCWLPLHICLFL